MSPQERCDAASDENYFGACPICGRHDGYRNIGKGHWMFCHEHRTRWFIGSNLFSSWREETEAEQREEAAFFYEDDGYRKVEPIYPTAIREDDNVPTAEKHEATSQESIWAVEEDILSSATAKTLREHVVDNALELFKAGAPSEIIAEELLLSGIDIMVERRGPDETIARLERLIENLPDATAAPDPRFRQ